MGLEESPQGTWHHAQVHQAHQYDVSGCPNKCREEWTRIGGGGRPLGVPKGVALLGVGGCYSFHRCGH